MKSNFGVIAPFVGPTSKGTVRVDAKGDSCILHLQSYSLEVLRRTSWEGEDLHVTLPAGFVHYIASMGEVELSLDKGKLKASSGLSSVSVPYLDEKPESVSLGKALSRAIVDYSDLKYAFSIARAYVSYDMDRYGKPSVAPLGIKVSDGSLVFYYAENSGAYKTAIDADIVLESDAVASISTFPTAAMDAIIEAFSDDVEVAIRDRSVTFKDSDTFISVLMLASKAKSPDRIEEKIEESLIVTSCQNGIELLSGLATTGKVVWFSHRDNRVVAKSNSQDIEVVNEVVDDDILDNEGKIDTFGHAPSISKILSAVNGIWEYCRTPNTILSRISNDRTKVWIPILQPSIQSAASPSSGSKEE